MSSEETAEQPEISINALDLAGENLNQQSNSPTLLDNQIQVKSTSSLNSCSAESIKNESYNEQEINRLKDLVKQKEADNACLEGKLNEMETQSRAQIEELHLSLNSKLEQALKKIQESQKDKTSMVMKFVEAERKCIELNKQVEIAQSKLNDSLKDKQRLVEKLERFKQDMDKMNAENDKKLKELMTHKRDIEKLKEQIVLSDAREKAAQLKLKTEQNANSSLKTQIEQLNQELNELKKSIEKVETPQENSQGQVESNPNDSTDSTKSSENESNNEQQIIVKNSVIAEKVLDLEKEKLKKELTLLKSQLKDMFEERTTLRDKLKCMEQERNLQENSLSKYKETLQAQKQMNKELLNENLQLRESQDTWLKEHQEKKEIEQRLTSCTSELNDLQAEMNANQQKQNELLVFTSKLTEKNTQLQSENTVLSEKIESIKIELENSNKNLKESNESVKSQIDKLKIELSELQAQNEKLASELKDKTKQVEELTTKLSDEQDENASIKKKHAANIKDLSRQLQSLQKKLTNQQPNTPTEPSNLLKTSQMNQSLEHKSCISSQVSASSLGRRSSRTSSISSLNDKDNLPFNDVHDDTRSIDSSNLISNMSTPVSSLIHQQFNNEVICGSSVSTSNFSTQDDVYIVDVDKQKIIDKIVKLQKTLAKRNEKIDFLQDHVNQLTNDLKRKTKIIQAYAMNEDVGAFTSEAQDAIKREMSRKTGIMSTLYNTNKIYLQTTNFIHSNESNMTMELCLEINRKLQALLEDTLMKNLTLKESLETLGQEIAKLSKENRDLKLKH